MKKLHAFWILQTFFIGVACADDRSTITTYYPSPRGDYQALTTTTFSSTGATSLATGGGNIGIGTANPATKLDVAGGQLTIDDGAFNAPSFKFRGANTGLFRGNDDRIEFVHSGFTGVQMYPNQFRFPRGSAAAPGMVLSDATTTGIYGAGAVNAANIGFSISGAEKMRLDSSGNLGVGVTSPGASLEVGGTGAKFSGAIATEAHADTNLYAGTFSGTPRMIFGGTTTHEIDNSMGVMRFFRPGAVDMAIDAAGNVGVGTSAPGQKLTVAGTVESTSGGFKFPDATIQSSKVVTTMGRIAHGNQIPLPSGYTEADCNWMVSSADDGNMNSYRTLFYRKLGFCY